jgi:hypothetical protein
MSQQAPPQLTPSALFEDQARLDAMRLQVYNRILANVHQKIRYTSTLPNSPQMTYYDVPEWQPGCPRFDVKDCILYVIWNLRNSGFKVLYVSPNRMVVSWKEQSNQYYQEESPIRRAMIAATNQSAPPAPAPKSSDKPEKKKAATYRPAAEGVAGMLAQGNPSRKSGSTITFI